MPYTGEVSAKIYYGTLFDEVNVPYDVKLIRTTATKTLTIESTAVWQSTWIVELTVNVRDYQEIVGAQYVEMADKGAIDKGEHWYRVMDYHNVAQETCVLGLLYDPILSIGINNMSGITGTITRWTVDDDRNLNYAMTEEPIIQTRPWTYDIEKIRMVRPSKTIIGSNVNLATTPTPQEDGKLSIPRPPQAPTVFMQDTVDVSNNILYFYPYDTDATLIKNNMDKYIGYGVDVLTQIYKLPSSLYYNLVQIAGYPGTNYYSDIKAGGPQSHTPQMRQYETGYKNSKASVYGNTFTLFNNITGDAVSVSAYQLSDLKILIFTDPSPNGGYFATFAGYMNNNLPAADKRLGMVKSVPWNALSYSSNMPAGYLKQEYLVNQNIAVRSEELELTESKLDNQMAKNALQSAIGFVGSIAGGAATGAKFGGAYGAIAGGILGLGVGTYNLLTSINDVENMYKQKALANAEFDQTVKQSNINRNYSPTLKFANTNSVLEDAYDFYLLKTSLSPTDRELMDVFFTRFGYNVGNVPLNSADQLSCRARFTYIAVDGFRLINAFSTSDLTRIHDQNTREYIAQRFANGLRIWKVRPNYNYALDNPIVNTSGLPPTDDNPSDGPGDITPVVPQEPPTGDTNADKILQVAISQIGTAETPLGSNNVKYNTAYYNREVSGTNYPWCAVFVWWVFQAAGVPSMYYGGNKTASCTTLMGYYKQKNKFIPIADAQPGDLVFYTWDDNPNQANHVGILEKKLSASSIQTIEGNTSDRVMRRTRTINSEIIGAAHPY